MAELRGLGQIFTLDQFRQQRTAGDQSAAPVSLEPGGGDAAAFIYLQTQVEYCAADRLADLGDDHRRIMRIEIADIAGLLKMSSRGCAQFAHDRRSGR